MNDDDRKRINDNRVFLVKNLDLNADFLACLRSTSVILEDHEERMRLMPTRLERCSFLIDLLQKRGPEAFKHFMDALDESEQGFIKEKLMGDSRDNTSNLSRFNIQTR